MALGVILCIGASAPALQAQDADEAPPAAENAGPAEAADDDATTDGGGSQTSLGEILYGGSIVNLIVWILIFITSAATLALIVITLMNIKRDKLMPEELVEGVRASLDEGDLNAAMETCEANPGPLSSILMIGFANITEGYEVIQEAVGSAAEMENEKLMQQVNYLNLCGQIAPMLGLLGTVLGMVRAFGALGGATGAAKASMLASSISTALWTTAVGLLIAVPAIIGFALIRNYATRIILEIEATVLDLIKVLRGAEVEEE
jgi:biopolymer transport protein ExbB